MVNIQNFKGREYDKDKLTQWNEKVEAKIEKIEAENFAKIENYSKKYEEWKANGEKGSRPTPPFSKGFCTFCGAVRPSGEIGIGHECAHITNNFKKGYIEQFMPDTVHEWELENFENYKKYAKFARIMFLKNNKKAKNEFIKSFYKSLEGNKDRISSKMLAVIERNAEYKNYFAELKKFKDILTERLNFKKYLTYMSLDFNFDFALYCQIQYAKAWTD